MISINQVKKWLGKRRMQQVQCIEIDNEVIEVVLINGLINSHYEETIWMWGFHHFECGSTIQDCKEDLISWFNNIEPEC